MLGGRRMLGGVLLSAWAAVVPADERVAICHGYGCLAQVEIEFSDAQLAQIAYDLFPAVDAASERILLARAIGQLYAWAGAQSVIRNDRGGNYADGGVPGKMDCIDHATSTGRLLALLDRHRVLRWHRPGDTEVRYFIGLVPNHWSAVIEETGAGAERAGEQPARFVVDSWFVNNGEPAVILPLEAWKEGAGPDV